MPYGHRSKKTINIKRSTIYWVISIFLVCSFLFSNNWGSRRGGLTINEVSQSPNTINLSLSPDDLVIKVDETRQIILHLDAQQNPVLGALIELAYNPEIVQITDVRVGDFFPNQLAVPKISGSKVALGYGLAFDSQTGKTSSGNIASFHVRGQKPGEFSLEFTKNTNIIPSDQVADDVITTINSLKIKVIEKDKSEVAIPTSTPAPTQASPTLKPTPKPTSTPKPKITPSPTPSSSPRVYIPLTNTAFDQSKADYPPNKYLTDPSLISDPNQTDSLASPETKPSLFDMVGQFFTRLFKPN